MSDRKGLFKNADRDMDKMRRHRQDHSVEIRKVIKDDHLQKRRNIQIDDLSDASPSKENCKPVNSLSVKEICRMMKSAIFSEKIDAVTACRKQLSKQRNPPIEQFYINGAVPILVEMMRSSKDETLLFEAAWALTNIASGESRHTAAVVDAGAVSVFIGLIEHTDEHISEQCVWALANIAGDSAKDRNMVVDNGIVAVLKRSVRRFWNNIVVIRQLAWFISNICRHKSDDYPVTAIVDLLSLIHELMTSKDDSTLHMDLTWALSYATDNHSSIIDAVIINQLLPIVNKNLSRTNEIVAPSIRLMGNIIAGTDEQANAALEAGVITSMGPLLSNQTPRIVKECCWLLSNISAGTEDQVMALVNSNIVLDVLEVLAGGEYKAQKEAVWVISNMVTCKKDEPRLYLLNNNIFPRLIPMLSCDDNKIVMLILESIKALFGIADSYGQLEQCVTVFESAGGIDVIEDLQNHSSDEVYKLSYEIVKEYLGAEDEDDEEVDKADTLQQFAF